MVLVLDLVFDLGLASVSLLAVVLVVAWLSVWDLCMDLDLELDLGVDLDQKPCKPVGVLVLLTRTCKKPSVFSTCCFKSCHLA